MTLQSSKTLGGVGALLMVITPFIGVFSWVIGLIGLILVMVALKGLSSHYSEGGIFNNALYGIIIAILGGAISVAVVVVIAVDFLLAIGIDIHALDWSDPAIFTDINWEGLVNLDIFWTHVAAIFGTLILLFIFIVIASIFFRKSLKLLSEKTGVGLFGTTGLIILIGAVLTIILFGWILLFVALILLAISFFSIKT